MRHSEIHSQKSQNVRHRGGEYCPECEQWKVHSVHCSKAALVDYVRELKIARRHEDQARQRAAYWLDALNQAHGKIAILKHENNKLRAKLTKP